MLILSALTLWACREPRHQDPVARTQRFEQQRAEAAVLRPRAEKLRRSRALQRWGLLTGQRPTSRRRPGWISFQALARLRLLENNPRTSDSRRRALRLQRLFLTREHMDQWPKLRLQLDRMIHARHRAGEAQLSRLELAAQKQRRLYARAAHKMDLTLVHLEQEQLELDLAALLARSWRVVWSSDALWARVRAALAPGHLTVEQLQRLRGGGEARSLLPGARQQAAVTSALAAMGLRLRTRSGAPITVTPGQRSAALVVAPDDVRLVAGQAPGLMGQVELMEAAGQAVCLGHGPETWELATLGQRLGARTLGHLLGLVWLEPGWRSRHSARYAEGTAPGAPQLAALGRHRVLANLVRQRVWVASLSSLSVMAGYRLVDSPKKDDSRAAFWRSAHRAHLPFKSRQGPRYIQLLPLSVPPLDMRVHVLAHMLLQRLRAHHGAAWYETPQVGPWLLKRLCTRGSVGHRRLLLGLGYAKLDLAAPARNLKRAWKEANP